MLAQLGDGAQPDPIDPRVGVDEVAVGAGGQELDQFLDRAQRQGYAGHLLGENISETYENEIAALSGWMQTRDTRDVLMDPAAREIGFGWFQEQTNKIWWTALVGG